MVLEVVCDRSECSGNFFLSQKLRKWFKNGPKTEIFKFIGKFGHSFAWNLFYNESLYHFLYSCTNPIFGKIFVLEIWVKMFSVNPIVGFFNQPYSKRNQRNRLIFCILMQIHINQKLIKKFWAGMVKNVCGQSGHENLKLTVSQK